jgi:hypothetical protein
MPKAAFINPPKNSRADILFDPVPKGDHAAAQKLQINPTNPACLTVEMRWKALG